MAPMVEPVAAPSALAWHLVYTKARQEDLALDHLQRQGYTCYLPRLRSEKIRRRQAVVVTEPMFPRYLFVRLGHGGVGPSWAPIRSTQGVQQLIHFGHRAAQVSDALIHWLRQREGAHPTQTLFQPGDTVLIIGGPLAGAEAIFQTADAERRAMILLDILSRPVHLQIDSGQLRKAA